ncbi:MAG: chromate resistance protein, partial [Planctomycetes bacterium]|nr:chromate resistance protein [Planctomycetota bacterium]
MKYTKYIMVVFGLAVLLLIGFMFKMPSANIEPQKKIALDDTHIYITWDTMEFDKCVAAWLIVRFIDKDAQFKFIPVGSEPVDGIPFDIPGAAWSRKHRKCTSQCILESIDDTDIAVEAIVSMAGKVELNFWQLYRWPKAQK